MIFYLYSSIKCLIHKVIIFYDNNNLHFFINNFNIYNFNLDSYYDKHIFIIFLKICCTFFKIHIWYIILYYFQIKNFGLSHMIYYPYSKTKIIIIKLIREKLLFYSIIVFIGFFFHDFMWKSNRKKINFKTFKNGENFLLKVWLKW